MGRGDAKLEVDLGVIYPRYTTGCKIQPANSLHFDYCVKDSFEREANKTFSNTKDKLRARIIIVFTNLNKGLINNSSRRLRSRLKVGDEADYEMSRLFFCLYNTDAGMTKFQVACLPLACHKVQSHCEVL